MSEVEPAYRVVVKVIGTWRDNISEEDDSVEKIRTALMSKLQEAEGEWKEQDISVIGGNEVNIGDTVEIAVSGTWETVVDPPTEEKAGEWAKDRLGRALKTKEASWGDLGYHVVNVQTNESD